MRITVGSMCSLVVLLACGTACTTVRRGAPPTPPQPIARATAPIRDQVVATPTPAPITPTPTPTALPDAVNVSEPGSLLQQISRSTAPNVAMALRLVEDGRRRMDQGQSDEARERFERAVAIDPTNGYGYYFLAQVHYQKKRYDQAIAFAHRAAALSAQGDRGVQARSYSLQGAIFEEVGRFADARQAYERALQVDPNDVAARAGLARLNAGTAP